MTHTEARELASQFGSRMCDENGDTHGEELYCFSLDDIIAIKEALAQPDATMQSLKDLKRTICDEVGKAAFAEPAQHEPLQFKCTVIDNRHPNGIPLDQWVHSPQRTWVGLTEIEADKIYKDGSTFGEMMRMVEAKLKEKNT